MDPETDRKIANHVILGHKYRPDHGGAGHDSDYDDDDSDDEMDDRDRVHSVWQRNRHSSHVSETSDEDPHSNDILQHDFLRKYLHFAKNRMRPELSEGAREFIANRYAEMRCRQDERTLPITARTLETVIRLASAHAKARLSNTVEAKPDCEVAMDVLSFALYHDDGEQHNYEGEPQSEETPQSVEVSDDGEGESDTDGLEPISKRQRTDDVSDEDRLKSRILMELAKNDGYMTLDDICQDVDDRDEITNSIESLAAEGKIMTEEDEDGTMGVFPVSD
jgi:DNA replication licensing factor MCM3